MLALKIHEYQAKDLLQQYGVPVPKGVVAESPSEALKKVGELGEGSCVVKAQIHAGGRGKGGGVKVCRTRDEMQSAVNEILGMNLVTVQTGPEGQLVKKVLIEQASKIRGELYLGLVIDRQKEIPVMMASAEGGMAIEEVAATNPEAIFFENIDPNAGLQPFQARRLATRLNLPNDTIGGFSKFATCLTDAFLAEECSLAEINPLVLTDQNQLIALDAKINFDDNALYRHPTTRELRDLDEENPMEVRASEHELSYISMDGNIGCMVNGAGLAMATMDIIKIHGGEPANFLDVGGGATAQRVAEALRIILSDQNVRAILINIFGGIVRCDLIAEGITEAVQDSDIPVPLIVRLEGNMVEQGKKILANSELNLITADSLDDAARKAVNIVTKEATK